MQRLYKIKITQSVAQIKQFLAPKPKLRHFSSLNLSGRAPVATLTYQILKYWSLLSQYMQINNNSIRLNVFITFDKVLYF
jgi:homoserine trans-succinylase